MDKYTKLFIAVLLIVGFGLGGIWLYNNIRRPATTQTPQFPENPQKGDFGYQEEQTTVEIGTQGTAKATFNRVENGNIFINEGGEVKQYPLTVDEVVIACTSQDLEGAAELDYDAITKILISNPAEIGGKLPANEPVVVFSQDVEGVVRVHTVAMSAEKCPLD